MTLDGLLFREEQLTDAIDQIRVYFHEQMQTQLTPAVLEETLQQVSGELHAEYREVKKMLEKGRAYVTKPLVQKVKERFAPIRGRIASDLARLSLLIEPPRPQPPDPNWGVTEWVGWALESYLPYHFWQEETGRDDEEIADYSEQYQDWYFKNYLVLRGQYPQMLHRAIVNIKAELGGCERALFVVIDNFNYKFLPVMEELMRRGGYVAQGHTPYLALIPTETDVCKKCLLAGEPERSAIDEASYENILTTRWKDDVGNRSLVYLPNVKRLRELTRLDADIYFLNYLALDDVLHTSDDHTGISHTEAARNQLQALVASIDEFAQRFQIEEPLTVYITADHGSTKIAAGVVNVIDPKFYQKVNLDRHHRFVTVSDAQLRKLPDNTAFQCYVLERNSYGLEHNYLIARRYYRFMKTEESFYVHGGLTPEETIVPFVTFRKVPLEMKEPTLTLKDSTFRYHVKSAVVLDVVNPNTFPLQNLQVALEAIGLDDEATPPLEELPALSSVELTIPCRFRRGERELDTLRVLMTYECAGHQRTTSSVFTITVKAMMERQTRRFR